MSHNQNKSANTKLPSKNSVQDSIQVVEKFRDICRFQLDLGYWVTADFPSKHHINRLLQLGYRSRSDLVESYGDSLTRYLLNAVVPMCRAYVQFTRDPFSIDGKGAADGQKMENQLKQNPT